MLIHPDKSCLLVIDIQEKLLPAVQEPEAIERATIDLIEIADKMGVPILCSEQYPQGLGGTVAKVRASLPKSAKLMQKLSFSCVAEASCNEIINSIKHNQIIICGMETHVCVLQTAIQLRQQGREVYVVADAVSSRRPQDKEYALARLTQAGVHIVTREMVIFEWLQKAGNDRFREISKRIAGV